MQKVSQILEYIYFPPQVLRSDLDLDVFWHLSLQSGNVSSKGVQ
jgi:hypothetical protein